MSLRPAWSTRDSSRTGSKATEKPSLGRGCTGYNCNKNTSITFRRQYTVVYKGLGTEIWLEKKEEEWVKDILYHKAKTENM